MTTFEATNAVFNITDENNSLSINIPVLWRIPNFLEDRNFDKLKSLLKLRSKNDNELQVEEDRKRGN